MQIAFAMSNIDSRRQNSENPISFTCFCLIRSSVCDLSGLDFDIS